jgi:hypothetical protein
VNVYPFIKVERAEKRNVKRAYFSRSPVPPSTSGSGHMSSARH